MSTQTQSVAPPGPDVAGLAGAAWEPVATEKGPVAGWPVAGEPGAAGEPVRVQARPVAGESAGVAARPVAGELTGVETAPVAGESVGVEARPATRQAPAAQSSAAHPAAAGRLRPAHPVLLRWARLVGLAVGGFLLPWCVLLAIILPTTAQAHDWSLAWVGLDGAEAIAALTTAALLRRADIRAGLAAVATGTLLLIDAWFDICTSAPGVDRALALAEASVAEVPLAVAAWWLALTLIRRYR